MCKNVFRKKSPGLSEKRILPSRWNALKRLAVEWPHPTPTYPVRSKCACSYFSGKSKMAAEVETCGSCCLKLKDLIKGYENELGLSGKNIDGTKSMYACFLWAISVLKVVFFAIMYDFVRIHFRSDVHNNKLKLFGYCARYLLILCSKV